MNEVFADTTLAASYALPDPPTEPNGTSPARADNQLDEAAQPTGAMQAAVASAPSMKLNDAQRQAAEFGIAPLDANGSTEHSTEGGTQGGIDGGDGSGTTAPLLIIAGAGSGKTQTLAQRVANLLRTGAHPAEILLLTFSRRAASQMSQRVARLLADAGNTEHAAAAGRLEWSGTFHAVGARLLRDYASVAGLNPGFSISDRDDAADLMHLVRHDLDLGNIGRRFPTKHTCLAIYSRVVNTMMPLDELLQRYYPWCVEWHDSLRALFRGYVEAKQAQDVLDYDDLLLYWARLAAHRDVARELDTRFRHILVDEYQDTNRLQAAILLAIKPHGRGLTVVGDDAQSIYSFRGAEVGNILEFPSRFDPPATIITLERNYRSTQPILAAANAVISQAKARHAKQLWSHRDAARKPALVDVRDEAAQAQYVAEQVLESREAGVALRAQAILFRASHHSAALEVELARRKLPFVKFGGLKFLDASHVKDVLGVLRFAQNPLNRVAGFRVLQLLPGIGPAAAQRVMTQRAAAGSWQEVAAPSRAVEGWVEWIDLMAALAAPARGAGGWPAEVDLVCRWYAPHLQRMHEDFAARAGDLSALAQIAATFASREAFLTELTLDPPSASSAEAGAPLLDEDYLILSTIHSAKGQEWQRVFVLNGVDGCIPSDMATGAPEEIEEERRLLYVAMTRAKDQLDIVVPQRFYLTQQTGAGDRHVYAARTRFIPQRFDALFERRSWPPAVRTAVGSQALAAVKLDIAAQMRSMWD